MSSARSGKPPAMSKEAEVGQRKFEFQLSLKVICKQSQIEYRSPYYWLIL